MTRTNAFKLLRSHFPGKSIALKVEQFLYDDGRMSKLQYEVYCIPAFDGSACDMWTGETMIEAVEKAIKDAIEHDYDEAAKEADAAFE